MMVALEIVFSGSATESAGTVADSKPIKDQRVKLAAPVKASNTGLPETLKVA